MAIHWYQILFQIINFGILIFVLNKFLYKPILKIIEQRNKKIEDSIKAAESALKEKATIEVIKKKAVEEAEKEAVKIIEASRSQAGQTGKTIIEEAREQAAKEVDKKLILMTDKLNQQEAEITHRLTDLVVKTTGKVLKDSLSPQEQKAIIDQEINQLAKLKWVLTNQLIILLTVLLPI